MHSERNVKHGRGRYAIVRLLFVISCLYLGPNSLQARPANLSENWTEPEWKQCITTLSHLAQGKVTTTDRSYFRYSVRRDDIFVKHLVAIAYVESHFQSGVISPAGAYGLMQMTPAAADEAATECHIRKINPVDLLNKATNIRYASCYLRKLYRELSGNWLEILISYNGGGKQLTRFRNGDTVANETANYVLNVERALQTCSK